MVSPQVVFLLEYKGGGGGVCIEYKQGTVENWLPIAANECICVCVGGGVWWDGGRGGHKDIKESHGGDQFNLLY